VDGSEIAFTAVKAIGKVRIGVGLLVFRKFQHRRQGDAVVILEADFLGFLIRPCRFLLCMIGSLNKIADRIWLQIAGSLPPLYPRRQA
jgi:hypothetical protein